MSFKEYEIGLKDNLRVVSMARKAGVILSRKERIDYMFKRQYAISEGYTKEGKLLKSMLRHATDYDYRLAEYLAYVFSSVKAFEEDGFSFSNAELKFKHIVDLARSYSLCIGRYKILMSDKNGKFFAELYNKNKLCTKFKLGSVDDLCMSFIACASLLVGSGETSKNDREWVQDFLLKEYGKVKKGNRPEPYFDKGRVLINLEQYLKENKEKELKVKEDRKIISFKVV